MADKALGPNLPENGALAVYNIKKYVEIFCLLSTLYLYLLRGLGAAECGVSCADNNRLSDAV